MYGGTQDSGAPAADAGRGSGSALRQDLLSLSDIEVRHGFIQKVYCIVGTQLCLTTVIASAVVFVGKTWVMMHPAATISLMSASLIGSVAMMSIFACCPQVLRKSPQNYLILFGFTVCKSLLIGLICLDYTLDSVLLAVGITAVVVLALTLFACQTSYDFTGFGPYLFAATMCLMAFSIAFMFATWMGLAGTPGFQTLYMIYAMGGAMLFSFYIVFDTQLIVGGKHAIQFSIDDYAAAAIHLYIDIVQLFLFILRIMGKRR